MNPASKALISAALQQKEPYFLDVMLSLATGVPSLPTAVAGYPIIFGVATNAGNLTQAAIDAFLGIAGDVTAATSFGATAMGTDSLGFVINMMGQAVSAISIQACLYDATAVPVGALGQGAVTTALTDALTTKVAVTAGGNLYGRVVATGLDASSLPLSIKIGYYLKYAV